MNPRNIDAWLNGKSEFGERLRRLRTLRKESQKAFCDCLNISERTLRGLENGNKESPQILLHIQKFLKLPERDRQANRKNYQPLSSKEILELGLGPFISDVFGNDSDDQEIASLDDAANGVVVGNYTINFNLVAGSLEDFSTPLQVTTKWSPIPFIPASKVIRFLWGMIFRVQESSLRLQGIKLHFRPLGRLVGCQNEGNRLSLSLEQTDYGTFAATNLSICNAKSQLGEYGRLLRRMREGTISCRQRYLASPLNVIAMVVAKDGNTFIPMRSLNVCERPGTWQASVGGAVESAETPQAALVRETKEELGIDIDPTSIDFFAFGINQITGEPDLLAHVETSLPTALIDQAFQQKAEKFEYDRYETWRLTRSNLNHLVESFHRKIWSQPSDRAAVVSLLVRRFGVSAVKSAFARLKSATCEDDQNRYFSFVP